jgi:eukaryotic-like serine/threonine-protein kinase
MHNESAKTTRSPKHRMSYAVNGYAAPPPLQPMQRFGPYQIEQKLGAGAVAVVYSAHSQDGRQVALKVLNPDAAKQPKFRKLLRNEYQMVARLHHPGVVQVYDLGEIDGHAYMAMELVQGPTLEEYMTAHGTLGETAAVAIVQQLARTLDYVHQQGVVHRDLKPANVLISRDGRALLFDFGAALNLRTATPEELAGIYGTPAFLSPEQIRSSADLDGRADLYSLGVILYRLVSGRKPFYGGRSEVLEAHLHQTPPKPSAFAYVSPELEAVILKAIAKAPEERFQTGAEFAAALQAAKLEPPPERLPLTQRILGWIRGTPAPAE